MAKKNRWFQKLFRALGMWILLIILGEVLWVFVLSPWANNFGATRAERERPLPGDSFVPNAAAQTTFAVTIKAPPEEVWKWLVQIGQDRGGFYSLTFLENLVGANIHNTLEIRPEWQELKVGDSVRLSPPGKGALVCPVLAVEPSGFLYLKNWGAFVLEPMDDGRSTRFFIRGRNDAAPMARLAIKLSLEPIHFIMQRRMMLGIKAVAEAGPAKPAIPSTGDYVWFLSLVAAGLLILILAAGRMTPKKFAGIIGTTILVLLALFRFPPSPVFGGGVLLLVFIAFVLLLRSKAR